MDIKRRVLLTEKGEPLLVSTSPIEAAIRFGQFSTATGIPPGDLLSSPLCAMPLPLYPAVFDAPRRWSSVPAEAMWHPLLWLPKSLAHRYTLGGGEGRLEGDEVWSVRVALELTASGLYDEETGTWMDVLTLAGIDIDEPDDLARVRAWVAGTPDAVLDGLDLSEHLDTGDPDWAIEAALASVDYLRVSSFALSARDLIDTVEDLVAEAPQRTAENAAEVLSYVASLARAAFNALPAEREWWPELQGRLADSPDDRAIPESAPEMLQRLTALHDRFWPKMIAQTELIAVGGPAAAPDHAAQSAQAGPDAPRHAAASDPWSPQEATVWD